MEYTVQKLANLAGITARTLRYYDEYGILKPARISSSGYRIYGQKEVNRLQQILFYRELGLELENIKQIITSPHFDESVALKEHREKLLEKRKQLDVLLANVNKTIASAEGRMTMTDQEKFEGFKQKMIDDNEQQYGNEIREKYGEDTVNRSVEKLKGLSQEQFEEMNRIGNQIIEDLAKAMDSGNPASEQAQKVAELHKRWLSFTWGQYSKEAHAGLAQMYVDDERFSAYYDVKRPGAAKFLRDAIHIYTKES